MFSWRPLETQPHEMAAENARQLTVAESIDDSVYFGDKCKIKNKLKMQCQ